MTVFHRPAMGAGSDPGPGAHRVDVEVSREFLDRIPGGVFRYRSDGTAQIDYVNQGLIEMLGCATYEQFLELTGNSFWGVVHPDDRDRVRRAADGASAADVCMRYRVACRDGAVRWVDGRERHVVDSAGDGWFYATVLDVTDMVALQGELDRADERHETLAMLDSWQQRAEQDDLTRVSNRAGCRRLIDELLSTAAGRPCSFFVVDVDDFKVVNDTWGHPAGDRVLTALARHLRASVRRDDVVARVGGDEFVVFAMGLGPGPALESLAQRICDGTLPRERAEERGFGFEPPTLSVGVATSPNSAVTVDELYEAADAALYEAKQSGKGRACLRTV